MKFPAGIDRIRSGYKATSTLLYSLQADHEIVTEIVQNNVLSRLIETHLLDPQYFEKMSTLLPELIAERKRGALKYQEYLKKMANFIKTVNKNIN